MAGARLLRGELELISHGFIQLDVELARALQGDCCIYAACLLNLINDVADKITFGLLYALANLMQVILDQPHNEQALSGSGILGNIFQLVANARIQDDVELAFVHKDTQSTFEST